MGRRTIHIVLSISCLLFSFKAIAQNNIPVLSWQTHFSYNQVNSLTAGENKIFAAANQGIFYLDFEDNSLNLINKNTGLSDVDIATIHYDNSLEALVVGYRDGGIDFWSNGSVETISTVEEANITGSKSFRKIQSTNNRIYFSGDLGVVVYDKQRAQIIESYLNLGLNGSQLSVNELFFKNDSIYAITEDGILSAFNDASVNLLDFNNWQRTLVGLAFENITEFNGELYASSDRDIFTYNGLEWTYLTSINSDIKDLGVIEGNITALANQALFLRQGDDFINTKPVIQSNEMLILNNTIWLASQDSGLTEQLLSVDGSQAYIPNGPVLDTNSQIYQTNNQLFFLHNSGYSTINKDNRTWDAYIPFSNSNLTDLVFDISLPTALEAPIRSDFNGGIFSAQSSTNLLLDFSNQSTIERVNNSYGIQAMAAFESDLWITTRNSNLSLHRWNIITDTWTGYQLGNSRAPFPTNLFIANNGDKWITIDESEGGGILVFKESSNRERYLNINGGQGGLPGRKVNDIAYDEDQFLWLATDGGVAFFPRPDDVLEGSALTASIPIFENRLLLRNEHITAISIDPANRKWFGSLNNGLWLFSETGEELIYHFTAENSPLPSNQILAIELNPSSGEIFIATDKGLVSFRSDATEGQPTHSNVKIYPNPVSPSFQGNIVLEGLVNNARVKITDVSGKLVKDLRANGSTAIWNVRDLSNARVSTGVYLVFSSNRDGSETYVGKIVVI